MDTTPQTRFPENLPAHWREHLSCEANKDYFRKLIEFLRTEYQQREEIYPPRDKILRALQSLDYPDVKVVILGQDPYPGQGHAVGLCFAVPNVLTPKPPSLVNIFKEIRSDLDKQVDSTRSELSRWVEQGVLLLNTVLTVRKGKPFSHRTQGWEIFTDRVIQLLNEREDPIVFILWGAHARKKKELITGKHHRILESAHPSPLSAHNGFFGSRPFSKANRLLEALKKEPIRWEETW